MSRGSRSIRFRLATSATVRVRRWSTTPWNPSRMRSPKIWTAPKPATVNGKREKPPASSLGFACPLFGPQLGRLLSLGIALAEHARFVNCHGRDFAPQSASCRAGPKGESTRSGSSPSGSTSRLRPAPMPFNSLIISVRRFLWNGIPCSSGVIWAAHLVSSSSMRLCSRGRSYNVTPF